MDFIIIIIIIRHPADEGHGSDWNSWWRIKLCDWAYLEKYIYWFIVQVNIFNARLWKVHSAAINIRQAQHLFIKNRHQLHVATGN